VRPRPRCKDRQPRRSIDDIVNMQTGAASAAWQQKSGRRLVEFGRRSGRRRQSGSDTQTQIGDLGQKAGADAVGSILVFLPLLNVTPMRGRVGPGRAPFADGQMRYVLKTCTSGAVDFVSPRGGLFVLGAIYSDNAIYGSPALL